MKYALALGTLLLGAPLLATACGDSSSSPEPADGTGASTATGGVATGGVATGGVATGGVATGGVATGGTGTGGVTTGGAETGGVATGGATGGAATGGAALGGAAQGGAAQGGGIPGGAAPGGAETGGGPTGGGPTGGAAPGGAVAGGASNGGAAGSDGGAAGAANGGAGGVEPLPPRRVLLAIFEPPHHITGEPLWVASGYADPDQLTAAAIEWWAETSGGRLTYEVVETLRIPEFPVKADGYTYTYATWLALLPVPLLAHTPDEADYDVIIADTDLCARVNAGEVDELWMFGGPYFGFAESALAGPGGFPYNGPSFAENTCSKLVPIMGFSYERALPEMIEDFGHRTEATMTQVFGGWAEDRMSHDWDRFGLVAAQSPSFGMSGCGSVHYPPNGTADYEYDRALPANTYCDAFLDYPALPADLGAATVPVTCNAWGCTQLGYFRYWFSHLPRAPGATDGVANDWWSYFIDPNLARSCDAFDETACAAAGRCTWACGACFDTTVDAVAACSPCGQEHTLEGCDAFGGCAWYSCGPGRLNCWTTGTDPDLACGTATP